MAQQKEWWEEFPETENQQSDFHKIGVGDTKVRILTQFEKVNQLFEGEYPNSKYVGMVDDLYAPKKGESVNVQGWAWAIVKEEKGPKDATAKAVGEIKILQVGKGILKLLAQLRGNEEYAFDDFPMPYDVTIHNTGDGPTRYSITASRKNTEVEASDLAELEKKTPIADIIKRIRDKKEGKAIERVEPIKEGIAYPEESINLDDIPF